MKTSSRTVSAAIAAFAFVMAGSSLHADDSSNNQDWSKTKQSAGHAWENTKNGAQQAGTAASSGASTGWEKTKKGARHTGNDVGQTMENGGNKLQDATH